MAALNALMVICLSALIFYVFFKSKVYAEVGEMNIQENRTTINVSLISNDTKSVKEEIYLEEDIGEEESLGNELTFPTVAPATPHSEKLLPPLEKSKINLPSNEDENMLSKSPTADASARKQIVSDQRKETEQADEAKSNDLVPVSLKSVNLEETQKTTVSDSKDIDQKKETNLSIEKSEEVRKEIEIEASDVTEDLMKLTIGKPEKSKDLDDNGVIETAAIKNDKSEKQLESIKTTDENDTTDKDAGILESFKDWKEKQKSSKKQTELENTVSQNIQRKRLNKKTNYASNECGAKVVAANSEAENTAAILTENKDLYMLNPCSCNIWFVIELCEKVQAETVEIANFELFSSTPEKFNVYFSSRYPTREWQLVGSFDAKSERVIQSFDLQEKSYAKFVKIEMVRHFGKEHYCPLSLVRVFGRSEVEELEDSEDASVDHDNTRDAADANIQRSDTNRKPAETNDDKIRTDQNNFLKSATDVVIGLVNKATETLTGKAERLNETGIVLNRDEGGAKDKSLEGAKDESPEGAKDESPEQSNKDKSVPSGGGTKSIDTADTIANDNDTNKAAVENKTIVNNAKNFSSDLVVLLEGDDGEEETDSNQRDRKCIFSGEIQGSKCADPSSQFWIPYIFVYRICPVVIPRENGTRRIRIAIIQSNEIMNRYQTPELPMAVSNGRKTEQFSDAKTNGESINKISSVVSSTSFVSTTAASTSTEKAAVDLNFSSAATVSQELKRDSTDLNGSVASTSVTSNDQASTLESSKAINKTELSKKTNAEGKSSCDPRTPVSPDLSQLVKAALSSIHDSKKNTTTISTLIAEEPKKDEDNDTSKDPAENSKFSSHNKQDSHVDVLVINFDEKLGEGKAEVSKKTAGNVSEPISKSNTNTDSETLSNSTTVIEPSFSQPVTSSLGSLKTSETLSVAAVLFNVSSNQSLSKSDEASIQAASVLESSVFTQSVLIKATTMDAQTVPVLKPSGGGISDRDKDAFQLQPGKGDAQRKDAKPSCAVEPTVKIGSGSSGNNKESAILKLKSRVKALETNLSLSTLYLEEMSKRYRTALEDQQKHFKAKLNSLNLTLFEDKDIIRKQQKTIEEVTKQLLQLTVQFENFTKFNAEQQTRMSERYIFSCTIEALIIVILLWSCLTKSKSLENREIRRHSAPSMYQNGHAKPNLAITNTETYNEEHRLADNLPSESLADNNLAHSLTTTKRKRQRKKRSQSEDSLFSQNATVPVTRVISNRETTIVSSTAGVLFSAGRGIINGLTGAFKKQKKPIGSRQARALIDSNVYDQIKPFARSKSLGTIEEHDCDTPQPPQRHNSFESISTSKQASIMLDHDKRRG